MFGERIAKTRVIPVTCFLTAFPEQVFGIFVDRLEVISLLSLHPEAASCLLLLISFFAVTVNFPADGGDSLAQIDAS